MYSVVIPIHLSTQKLVDLTVDCISRVKAFSPEGATEIILVDNNSPLQLPLPTQKLVSKVVLPSNFGFAYAVNVGLLGSSKSSQGVAILNNDVLVTPDWLTSLAQAAETPWKAEELAFANGMPNPRLAHFKGATPGLSGPLTNRAAWFQGGFVQASRRPARRPVDPLVFFCAYVTSSCLRQVGPLDEDFGQGNWEDNEYCSRAILHGFYPALAAGVWVNHLQSQTWKALDDNAEYDRLLTENKALFEGKLIQYRDCWAKDHPQAKIYENPLIAASRSNSYAPSG